jgi:hypothetical protein
MNTTRYIIAGYFIDGTGGAIRKNVVLAVQDGMITAIDPEVDLPGDEPTALDDFSHCTIVPALIDCSVALSRSPSVDLSGQASDREVDLDTRTTLYKRHIQDCHAHGVLGVADCDDVSNLTKQHQQENLSDSIISIRSSGPFCRNRQDAETWPSDVIFSKSCIAKLSRGRHRPQHPAWMTRHCVTSCAIVEPSRKWWSWLMGSGR